MNQPEKIGGDPSELGAFLIARLLSCGVAQRQIDAARAYQDDMEGKQPFSRTLADLGLATDETVAQWIAKFYGWPYIPREKLRVEAEAHNALPEAIARSRHALVLSRDGSRLTVAVADPTTPQFAQVIHALPETLIDWVVSPQADIAALASECYVAHTEIQDNELERFVEEMIREAAHTRGVSDVHCIPSDRSCDIRWRMDGELVPWGTLPGSLKDALCAQLKLSSTRGADGRSKGGTSSGGLDVANHLDAQDASAIRDYGSKRVSLRYSVIPAINGESIVIRILDQSAQVGSLEDLGMLPDTALAFRAELRRPNGIILVSGPAGHGKSTTLAASVPCLDSRSKRILSVEDPVEYRLRTVTQAPVSPRLPFASALRAFLRHNPDIIIVGEIRDSETAGLATRLALTGHLILTTVHANTAIQAVNRLLDLGIEPSMISATARVFLGQRLVRRLCQKCRRPHRDAKGLYVRHSKIIGNAIKSGILTATEPHTAFCEAGGGCESCGRTGFSGRIGLFELRNLRQPVAEMLAAKQFDAHAAEAVFAQALAKGEIGSRSMREDGMLKVACGLTTLEEVAAATTEELRVNLLLDSNEHQ